jgi:lipoprotein-anchoring transpeptidase ErfK/SrfK
MVLDQRKHPRMTRRLGVVPLIVALALAAACTAGPSSGGDEPKRSGPGVTIVAPKADATNVAASAEIEFKAENATSAEVQLADAQGNAVEGDLGPEGTRWMPRAQLEYGTKYTTTVKATDASGESTTVTASFTTMAKPANLVRVSSVVGDDMIVGVGMPMIVQFGRDVPEKLRASVQRRMSVRSEPAQEGSWHWFSGSEVHYRPKEFWQPGTKLDMRVLVGGLPLGDGWYGRADLTVAAEIGDSLVMTVDNATKRMTVAANGRTIRTIPVSLGRPGMPSSSGTLLVMERLRKTVFDTRSDPNPANRYRINIEYAQRVTWGGQFIHAAPWSVANQGRRNVSHGCINMSTENARWLFEQTTIGDPVIVKGTEQRVKYGDGWTDWSMTWNQYVKGSALPAGEPSPSATG